MDRFDSMRVFVSVAEEQNFAATARKLGMSAPAVTRAVRALEDALGTRLLHRTSRVVRLTDVGARYLSDARNILRELDAADARVMGAQREARGELSVTAPSVFGRLHLTPVLLEFLRLHPQLTARTLFVDHVVDLLEEHIDVAVRIARLEDSALKTTRLGSLRRVLCASPAYLREHGTPKTPDDLRRHALIAFTGVHFQRQWSFRHGSELRGIAAEPRLIVNTPDTAVAAAVAGHGLTRVLSYQVEHELRSGALEVLLEDYESAPMPVQLVYAGRRTSARVRLFVDFAVSSLRPVLSRLKAGT